MHGVLVAAGLVAASRSPGWLRRAAASASRSARAATCSSCSSIRLTATMRSSRSSCASQTTPNAPFRGGGPAGSGRGRAERRGRRSVSRRAIRGLHHLRRSPLRRLPSCPLQAGGPPLTANLQVGGRRARGHTARSRRKCGASDHVLLRRRRADARQLGRAQARRSRAAARAPRDGRRRPARPRRRRARASWSRSASAIVVLIVLVLAHQGLPDSRKERALKDYNRDVATIISASNEEVSKPFFELLSSRRRQRRATSRSRSTSCASTPRRTPSAPGAGRSGRHAGRAAERRADAEPARRRRCAKIAAKLDAAQGRGQQAEAGDRADRRPDAGVPGLRRDLVAARGPLIVEALDDADIGGQTVVKSQFLPGYTWLAPQTVAARDRRPGGGQPAARSRRACTATASCARQIGDNDARARAGLDHDPAPSRPRPSP